MLLRFSLSIRLSLLPIAALAVVFADAPSATAIPLLSGPGPAPSGATRVTGLEFTVGASDIDVMALGYWAGGLSITPHEVGLWQTDGTLLASVVVAPGSIPQGDYLWENLASAVTLQAGGAYVLGGLTTSTESSIRFDGYNPSDGSSNSNLLAPGFAVVDGRLSDVTLTLDFPALTATGTGNGNNFWTNANFETATVVPEPSTASLTALGVAALAGLRRRRATAE